MKSDWHIGSGAGLPGDIDAAVNVDRDGLPFLDGKTLHDMWRDACETAVSALDPAWAAWVEWLFGSQPDAEKTTAAPTAGHVFVGTARLEPALTHKLVTRPQLIDGLFGTRAAVAIDELTGTAKEGALRVTQMVRSGLNLHAEVGWEGDEPLPVEAQAVLLAGAFLLRRIGGKRRRGAGECAVDVNGLIEPKDAAEVLRGSASVPPAKHTPRSNKQDWSATESATVKYLIDIELLDPLLVVERVVGNQTVAMDHIPGAALMPMLTELNPELGGQFARGAARVLPAFPAVGGTRTVPSPRCMAVAKDGSDAEWVNLLDTLTSSPAQLKRVRGGYGTPSDDTWRSVAVETIVQMFNSVDDAAQRPLDDGVFAYETLATGTRWATELFVNPTLAITEGTFIAHLGRARRSRGRCSVTIRSAPASPVAPAQERTSTDRFTMWLLADTVVYDESLLCSPTPEDLAAHLSRSLGCDVQPVAAYADTAVRTSWQGRWQRPRPGQAVLLAGSVIVFTADPPVPTDALRKLQQSGVGDRRAEGYGDVVIDHWLFTRPSITVGSAAQPVSGDREPTLGELTVEDGTLVTQLEAAANFRLAMNLLDDLRAAGDLSRIWNVRKDVSSSQLGTARTQLLDTHLDAGRQRLEKWAANARKNHGRNRFDKSELDDLVGLILAPKRIWDRLGLADKVLRDPTPQESGHVLRAALLAVVTAYQRVVEEGER